MVATPFGSVAVLPHVLSVSNFPLNAAAIIHRMLVDGTPFTTTPEGSAVLGTVKDAFAPPAAVAFGHP